MRADGAVWVPNADVLDPADEYDPDYVTGDYWSAEAAGVDPNEIVQAHYARVAGDQPAPGPQGLLAHLGDLAVPAVSTPTQERTVSHKLTVTVTDEAHAALLAAAKKDESIQDTIRRLLHRSLKLPKPGK